MDGLANLGERDLDVTHRSIAIVQPIGQLELNADCFEQRRVDLFGADEMVELIEDQRGETGRSEGDDLRDDAVPGGPLVQRQGFTDAQIGLARVEKQFG